ncbi:ribosome-associated translation inhibitor RaiA [Patescibacteria group bacterium]|nr:ribosome-associated translation inhibitor RaiA [Patescibacteria group bacterium]
MNINLQGKNMDITEAIHDYVIKKITNLGKLLTKIQDSGGEVLVQFSVSKTTNHHRSGEVFRADCTIVIDGKQFHSSSDKEDMNEAIDDVKEKLFREIRRSKNKKEALFLRGANRVKNILKGLTDWKK